MFGESTRPKRKFVGVLHHPRGCFFGLTGYRIIGQGTGRVGIIWLGRV